MAKPPTTTMSANMKKLLENQMQIQIWLLECEKKLYGKEGDYLKEFPTNIVRGWQELDSKTANPALLRGGYIDDKERIFSSSSFLISGDKSLSSGGVYGMYGNSEVQSQNVQQQQQQDLQCMQEAEPAKKRKRKSTAPKVEKEKSQKFKLMSLDEPPDDIGAPSGPVDNDDELMRLPQFVASIDSLDEGNLELDILDDPY